jgi:hypothetical protein
MNDFMFFLREGWDHIISVSAMDHILFIISLAVVYTISEWKKVVLLLTAFTFGHAITLVLSVLNIIRFSDVWVEFLIPCTILITASVNLIQKDFSPRSQQINYFLALFFGLIHGMGYANAIRFSLAKGQGFGISLFSFNLGLEIGQIFVVLFLLLLTYLITKLAWISHRNWVIAISVLVFVVSLQMAIERFPFVNT